MRSSLFSTVSVCGMAAVLGCSDGNQSFSLMGKTLTVKDQNYGQTNEQYCENLAIGQFEVVFTDFPLCGELTTDAGNRTIFHTREETNLRLIFPSGPVVNPRTREFKVGSTNRCTDSATDGTQATAFFSHNAMGATEYDLNAEANDGKITVTDYDAATGRLVGKFDLKFGGDSLSGTFDAPFCRGIAPGLGAR